jgi:CheY-like chemotaxis protein
MPAPFADPEVAPERRPALRVVLADDDVLLREGLASLLDRSGFDVVGQAGNGVELVAAVRATRPDVAIVDIRMPPGHATEGLEAARVIARNCPRQRSSCCPRTWRLTRRWSCWPAVSGSAIC